MFIAQDIRCPTAWIAQKLVHLPSMSRPGRQSMFALPDRHQQMLAVHGPFIRQVVEASQTPGREAELDTLLTTAEQNGWKQLVDALRRILAGRRDNGVLHGLDEEDRVIAEAIMRGLQDPISLPHTSSGPDPTMAAPGLAGMIRAAASGDVRALQLVSEMAQQMSKAGGDMARLAAAIRPLINGERNPDRLGKGMSTQGEQLLLSILAELGQTDVH